MNREQFNVIVKILENGAPALANELVTALFKVLDDNAKLQKEITKLKAKSKTETGTVEGDK